MTSMALAKAQTPTTEYVKERLEQAGCALQRLPAEFPRGYKTAWPDIPRTSLEIFILQVQAESDPEVKRAIADEALRFKQTATREQIAALDDVLPWIYEYLTKRQRGVVMARSMSFGPGGKKISYNKLGHKYGMTGEWARITYNTAVNVIAKKLTRRTP